MGLFDFLKKAELAKITQLTEQIAGLSRYQGIVDVDAEKQIHIDELNKIKEQIIELSIQYDAAKITYEELKHQIDIYSESLDIAEYGLYEPHFNFDSSEQFKAAIEKIRVAQKESITCDRAVIGGETIAWNSSLTQGQAMVKRQKKLMLRAFNGECDSFIATVEWNNVLKMTERISKSFDAINKVYDTQGIYIAAEYRNLKIDELQLTYEYKKKKYEEKEEQRLIREQMREEEKVRREIEAAQIRAEKEEVAYQKALSKAREEAQNAMGDKQEKFMLQIAELEAKLSEAESNKERALSMAQQTRRGHVYVISNIGSFGENIYKIGMTRRLDPMDRVKELGDASVPFSFDVHAMIFSEDAPGLENILHKTFEEKRLNLINLKREFFNVSLADIETEVIKNHGQIEFTKAAEAQQYRESLAIRNRLNNKQKVRSDDFPDKLF